AVVAPVALVVVPKGVGQPRGELRLTVVARVVPFVLNVPHVVPAITPVPLLVVRQAVTADAKPSYVLVEGVANEGTFHEDVVAAAVDLIEVVRALLVADQ